MVTKELGIEKGSGSTKADKVGDLKIEQVVKIAQMKGDSLMGKDVKMRSLEVIGTCDSMGVTIDGKEPRAIRKDILDGAYDQAFVE